MNDLNSGRLSEIIELIHSFLMEVADWNGRKHKVMEIYYWLNYYPSLTQPEIQQITHFSSGTISTALKRLKDLKVVSESQVSNHYILSYSLINPKLSSDFVPNKQNHDYILHILDFSIDICKKIKPYCTTQSDFLLYENLKDFHQYFYWAKHYLSPESFPFDPQKLVKHVKRKLNPDISTQLHEFEQNFIHFFVKEQVFEEISEKNSYILAYFITRGSLTISKLAELVPYSIGTVSSCVNYLEKIHFIQKNAGTYGYSLYSFSIGWLSYRNCYYQRILTWKHNFLSIQQELESNFHKYHSNLEFPRFYLFFRKVQLMIERIEERYQKDQPLWNAVAEFTQMHSDLYPSLNQ